MSPAYATQILDLIISTATADSLPLDNLQQEDIVKFLASDEERRECIHVVLQTFSESPVERISFYDANQSIFSQSCKDISMVRSSHSLFPPWFSSNICLPHEMAIVYSGSDHHFSTLDTVDW
jgi:hypothetical protein